ADEDVRAVEARERVEDRLLRVVLRREADVRVLVDLHEQERRAEQERRQHARLQAEAVPVLDRGLRPVHRRRRGGEDRGVDAAAAAGVAETSTTMCSTGTGETPRTRSTRCERSHPERWSGSVEMRTSSTRNSSSALTAAVYGSGSPIMPEPSRPAEWTRSSMS